MSRPDVYTTKHRGDDSLPTHRHPGAYASLVLSGSYIEVSADGSILCEAGTLLIHPVFNAHGNRFGRRGARVVNLPLPGSVAPDALLAVQVSDLREARDVLECGVDALTELMGNAPPAVRHVAGDWQSAFVEALMDDNASIAAIARCCGVTAAHASRAIHASHGMSPQVLRRELRWRRALRLLRGDESLAAIAMASGFSDQSHLTRTTREATGLTPAKLRMQVNSVQDSVRALTQHRRSSNVADRHHREDPLTCSICPDA